MLQSLREISMKFVAHRQAWFWEELHSLALYPFELSPGHSGFDHEVQPKENDENLNQS